MAVNQPPEPSLTGIPPEFRNIINNLVADDIHEASIIGHKPKDIHGPITTQNAKGHLCLASTKHPLSKTCRQLRQEFGSIHQHRIINTGVRKYYLDLENYDLEPVDVFAKLISGVPQRITHLFMQSLFVVRFNIGNGALESYDALRRQNNYTRNAMHGLQDLETLLGYGIYLSVGDLELRTKRMSRSEKKSNIAQLDFRRIMSTLGSMSPAGGGQWMVFRLISAQESAYANFNRDQRQLRYERARNALKEEAERKLRAKIRS